MVFLEATSEPGGKPKKLTAWHVMPVENQRNCQHDMWCLITNTQTSRVAIVSSVITRYLTTDGHHSPFSICLCTVHQFLIIFVASLSAVVYQLLFVSLPIVSIHIHSFLYRFDRSALLEYSVFDYSFIQCVIFLFWYWNCIPGIWIHKPIQPSTIRKVNKHHTPDCAIFCLSEGSKGLITIIDTRGYPEPISPIWLAEGETASSVQFKVYKRDI
jgi:hypothetical protein